MKTATCFSGLCACDVAGYPADQDVVYDILPVTEFFLLYSWYSNDSIRHTQGAYRGRLLHGRYAEWYPNRQLKVTGSYHRGLKNGRWQYHDANGTLRKVSHWLYGRETGRFALYSPQGKRVQKGWLWDGEVVGKGREMGPKL